MTLEQIHQEAESFFEWPTDQHLVVTFMSAKLFARHIADKAVKQLEDDYRTGRKARP